MVMARIICPQCGSVSEVNVDSLGEDEDWLECVAPDGFEWTLPAGKITPTVGEPVYIDAVGKKFTREAYVKKYNIDPEIAYVKMREAMGGGHKKPVRVGRGSR
jgi:hypothetical protein